jgi:hypothetical protein
VYTGIFPLCHRFGIDRCWYLLPAQHTLEKKGLNETTPQSIGYFSLRTRQTDLLTLAQVLPLSNLLSFLLLAREGNEYADPNDVLHFASLDFTKINQGNLGLGLPRVHALASTALTTSSPSRTCKRQNKIVETWAYSQSFVSQNKVPALGPETELQRNFLILATFGRAARVPVFPYSKVYWLACDTLTHIPCQSPRGDRSTTTSWQS